MLVFIGGGIGAALRHGVNRGAFALLGPSFPYGTLLVNVTGGLLTGIAAGLFLAKADISQEIRLFVTTGLLGGFTTFSAFSHDAALICQRGDYSALAVYVLGSVILSIGGLFLGMAGVRLII